MTTITVNTEELRKQLARMKGSIAEHEDSIEESKNHISFLQKEMYRIQIALEVIEEYPVKGDK